MSIPLLKRPLLVLLALPLLVGCSLVGGNGDEPADLPWDTDIPESEASSASSGVWSPSGTRIAFRHSIERGSADPRDYDMLWTYDFTTGERRKITGGRVSEIDWHRTAHGSSSIAMQYPSTSTVDTTGQNLTPLTGPGSPNPDLDDTQSGAWSPNGEILLYSTWSGEPRGISIMKPDGSDAHNIIPYGISPSWFPSGERIIYVNWDTTAVPSRRRQLYTARDGI